MIAIVETDADDLRRPGDAGSPANGFRYRRQRGAEFVRPGGQSMYAGIAEERLVPVLTEGRRVASRAIGIHDARAFIANGTEADQSHRIIRAG